MKQLALIPLVAVLWIAAGCAEEDENYGERIGENIEEGAEQTGQAVEEAGDRIAD